MGPYKTDKTNLYYVDNEYSETIVKTNDYIKELRGSIDDIGKSGVNTDKFFKDLITIFKEGFDGFEQFDTKYIEKFREFVSILNNIT